MTSTLPARVAVLGCNGYLGACLVHALVRAPEVELVLGIGRQHAGAITTSKLSYVRGDLGTLPLAELFVEYGIEAICHCAFISRPLHDDREAFRCNVTATSRVFAAARAAGVGHAVLLSSVAVYGPRRRRELIVEDEPPAPNGFVFSRHKVLQERVARRHFLDRWFALTVVRPCTVVGPNAHNFLLHSLTRGFTPMPLRRDPQWQFLHEDDFVRAVLALMRGCRPGTFNITPDDTVPLREAVRLLGGRPVPVPFWLVRAAAGLGWALRLPAVPGPPSALAFLLKPPLAASRRLNREVGDQIRHSSREALLAFRSAPIPDPMRPVPTQP